MVFVLDLFESDVREDLLVETIGFLLSIVLLDFLKVKFLPAEFLYKGDGF